MIETDVSIGIMIHTPWPTSDIFRSLPCRETLLRSIVTADLVGFHTYDYVRHYLSCVKRILFAKIHTLQGGIMGFQHNGRTTCLRIGHVGIKAHTVHAMAGKQMKEQTGIEELRSQFKGKSVFLCVEDVDVTTGCLLKVQAFDIYLEKYPRDSNCVLVYVLTSIRSALRSHKKAYHSEQRNANLVTQLREEAAKINDRYSSPRVIIVDEPQTMEQMISYYLVADVALFASFWDGFNTVPYEYTAAQGCKAVPGALILSEFMGCVRSLGHCKRVNPWNLESVADALYSAKKMTAEERKRAHKRRFQYVMEYNHNKWTRMFLADLKFAAQKNENTICIKMGFGAKVKLMFLSKDFKHLKQEENQIIKAYRQAKASSPLRLRRYVDLIQKREERISTGEEVSQGFVLRQK